MTDKKTTKATEKNSKTTGAVKLVEEDLNQVQGGYNKLELKDLNLTTFPTGGSSGSPSRARIKKYPRRRP